MLLHRGLSGGGLVVLAITGVIDFFRNWRPELTLSRFLAIWALLFVVQTACMLFFLLPIATTVVKFHLERRLVSLWVLLAVAAISVTAAVIDLEKRRGHMVSWVTTERANLRTATKPDAARSAQLAALRDVWAHPQELVSSTDPRGWVEDDALDRAEVALEELANRTT